MSRPQSVTMATSPVSPLSAHRGSAALDGSKHVKTAFKHAVPICYGICSKQTGKDFWKMSIRQSSSTKTTNHEEEETKHAESSFNRLRGKNPFEGHWLCAQPTTDARQRSSKDTIRRTLKLMAMEMVGRLKTQGKV